MYEKYFDLRERPFDLTPNPRFLVLTAVHREALSNLEYGIAARKGLTVLTGEAGMGKTLLVRAALDEQAAGSCCVYLNNPTLTRAEFVELLATKFGLSHEARSSKAAFLLELEALLQERRAAGAVTVLVVDEAQSLPQELLEEVRLLANIDTAEEKLLQVILAGQPELVEHLNDGALRQLKQRIALRCELTPLTLAETASYIVSRISKAGGVPARLFTREAVTLIHDRSRGIPRTISVMCDNALLSAFASDQHPVDRQIVLDVCRDFDLEAAPEKSGTIAPTSSILSVSPPMSPLPGRDAAGPDLLLEGHSPVRPKLFASLPWRRRFYSLFPAGGSR